MYSLSAVILIAVSLMFMFSAMIIVAVVVGGWLVFKGKSTVENAPFLGRDTSPGAYAINVDDGQDFPDQGNEHEEHILKKTGDFFKTLGGQK